MTLHRGRGGRFLERMGLRGLGEFHRREKDLHHEITHRSGLRSAYAHPAGGLSTDGFLLVGGASFRSDEDGRED